MDVNAKPIANPVVVLREEFDDWAILFNPDTANAFGINPVGVSVWKILDGKHDLTAIVSAVSEEFADVPDSVTDDLGGFVDDLVKQGFAGYEIPRET
jgi:SynChlorMet cassette protein ScmD